MNKPVRHEEARYKTVDMIIKETNLCRSRVMTLASEADAIIRIGRAVRINSDKFFKYVDREYGC